VQLIFDDLVKSRKTPIFVIPAKAGIQGTQPLVDSRFRGSDGLGDFLHGRQSFVGSQYVESVLHEEQPQQPVSCFFSLL